MTFKLVRLIDIALIGSGKRPPLVQKASDDAHDVPIVGGGGVSGYTIDHLFDEPLLITGRVGTLGKLHYSTGRVWPSDNALVIRPRIGAITHDYLRFALSTVIHQAVGMNRGAANPLVTQTDLGALELPLPEIAEQDEIVKIVRPIEDRITLLRETNATLEAIAQALFKSWFVDFDPVSAKRDGRAPEGMDEATAAIFPDCFEDSELGEVPTGWRVGRVLDLGEVICGKTPPTSEPENYGDEVPFITIPDMHGRLVVTTTGRALSRKGADSQSKKYLPTGSICVSCIATPGLVVQVTAMSQTNQQINSVIPSTEWGQSFPLFLLRRIGDAVRMGGSGGSVFHNLSKSGFERLPVLLPCPTVARLFDALASPITQRILANQLQSETLATLRDTLLPRLISGQLRLPVAAEAIESVLAQHP